MLYSQRKLGHCAVYARIIFLAYALGLLLLVAACHRGGSCDDDYGGPYPKGGKFADKVLEQKLLDFERYKGLELNLSRAFELNSMDEFERSITANLPTPNKRQQQKYNYVITEECDILVARWDGAGDLSQIQSGVACAGGGDSFSPPTLNIMINWAPEEPYGSALASKSKPTSRSPCWLDAKREDGLLDAISKHFMLAQGKDSTIADFEAKKWAKARVAYAGEILVDLENCTYIVTENSGTYKPLGGSRPRVNEFFAAELGRNSRKISNVSPWCP